MDTHWPNLTANVCTLALLSGIYSLSDTLLPQAFGAGNNRELGLLAMQGFAVSMVVILPINIVLLFFMNKLFLSIGQDPEVSELATKWYAIYALVFPLNALYEAMWKFLSAQEIMIPLLVCLLLTLMALPLLLAALVPAFGCVGSALAIVLYELLQVTLLLTYLWWCSPHIPHSWPSVGAWREALAWEPMVEFLLLALGGVLLSIDWVYWEMGSMMIGLLGQVALGVHVVPYQVVVRCGIHGTERYWNGSIHSTWTNLASECQESQTTGGLDFCRFLYFGNDQISLDVSLSRLHLSHSYE